MNAIPVSARLATRPDLVREFVTIESTLVNTLKRGGEIGALRRSFEDLTTRTMQELGLTIKPQGVDYAMAGLTIAGRALSRSMQQNQSQESPHLTEAEEAAVAGRRPMRV